MLNTTRRYRAYVRAGVLTEKRTPGFATIRCAECGSTWDRLDGPTTNELERRDRRAATFSDRRVAAAHVEFHHPAIAAAHDVVGSTP